MKGREDAAVLLGFEGAARALGIGKGAGLQLERLVRVSRSLLMSFSFFPLFRLNMVGSNTGLVCADAVHTGPNAA